MRPKVRKLSKKILLVPATEAVDEYPTKAIEQGIEKSKTKKSLSKKPANPPSKKKLLIIENDDDDDA